MFREMRRKNQLLPDAESEAILRDCSDGVLAVNGDEGYPYAVPLNYVWDDGKIYFHCAKVGHKLDAIRSSDKVSFTVIASDEVDAESLSTRYRSVIVFGRAKILEDSEEIRRAALLLGLKYNPDRAKVEREIEAEMAALCCVEITPEHITGKEALSFLQERKKNG